MADRLSGHPNMNGPPLDLAFSDTSDSNSGSVDMLSNETVGERRTRLEGQVNEDNERDREDSRVSLLPGLQDFVTFRSSCCFCVRTPMDSHRHCWVSSRNMFGALSVFLAVSVNMCCWLQ